MKKRTTLESIDIPSISAPGPKVSKNRPGARETVVVVGLGYVGLPLVLLARKKGYRVVGIDTDPHKRENIRNGSIPDLSSSQEEELKAQPVFASGNYRAIKEADLVIVCVPTPVDHDHNPDLTPVRDACRNVGKNMRSGQTIILESTVHPGTCDEIVVPILEKESGFKAGTDFGLAHCPERINPGDRYWPLNRIPRVIGASDLRTLERTANFYRTILDALVFEMENIKEAEAVKVVENSFRDINIAFVNELAMSFSRLGIDIVNVLQGASTKPFGFMPHYPGCGVGGHCIPVDPYYLIRYAKRNGFSHEFLSLARAINEQMPQFVVETLARSLERKGKKLHGETVALLGLSYKADISDIRESPSFEIEKELKKRGAKVRTFDPYVPERSSAENIEEALKGANIAVVATAHKEFIALRPELLVQAGIKIVVDGRNCLSKAGYLSAGIAYHGVGR